MRRHWAAFACVAGLGLSGAQAAITWSGADVVTGDPAVEEMIAHLEPIADTTDLEIIDKHRVIDPSTGWGYLALKLDVDGEPATFWMNESSGLMSFDFDLLEQERTALFATLDPAYRKMSPDMLELMRTAQGGVLGARSVDDRRLSVVFFAESSDKLDAIIAEMTGVKPDAFDSVKLHGEKPPVVAPDESGNLPVLAGPPDIFAVTADLTVAEIVRLSGLDAVVAVEPEIFATLRLNASRVRIRANTAANFSVNHGFNADIAIVDSGIDDTHPALPWVIAEMDTSGSQQFCDGGARAGRRCDCPGGACGGGGTCVGGARAGKACNCPGSTCHEAVDDLDGHGTHVAGIAGSSDGTFTGMARLVDLINAKSLGGFTIGQMFAAGMPSVAAGLAFSRGAGADVINGSYGFAGCTAPGFCSGPGRCLGPGMCTRPRICTAPAASAGNPCANNAACDTAPGNGVCADAGWCTAGNVGAPCATNANCDTAPGNGVCTQRSRACNVAADCDSAAGAGDGFCAAARQCTAGNVGAPCVLNRDCDNPLGAGNGVCGVGTRMCLENDDCDSAAGANDGFCARAGACTAPGGSAGRPCVYNFDCDSAVGAGDGLCASAGACTAPAGSVGRNCTTNAACDSAPGAGDGACNPRGDLRPCTTDAACDFPAGAGNGTCSPASVCFATAATQGLLCQRDSDCDGVPGSGAGRCGPRPCIANADCDSAVGAGDGVCGTPTSNGSSRPSRDVDFEVYSSNITVTIAGEELSYHGRCSGGANNGQRCGYAFQCPGGTCQAIPSSPNDAFNVITVGSSNLAGPPSTVSSWSIVGPTADNRSKPDVLAPGESPGLDGIDSCNAHWESGLCTAPGASLNNACAVNADCDTVPGNGVCSLTANDFTDLEGTSMASPHVAGVAGLLWDLGDRHDILNDTPYIKAAILNNARRLAGWAQPQGNVLTITQPLDRSQGTGEMDAEATYRAYMNDLRVWQQRHTAVGEANSHWYWLDVPAPTDANTRIVVTLVFERHVTNAAAAAPALNDLDIRLYDPNCNLLRTSRSSVDSVEHIVFPNPGQPVLPAGRYCIEVLPFALPTDGSELYAVAANYPMQFLGKTKPCTLDFGDAPDPFTGAGKYPTRLASNGARHFDWTKEWLGSSRPEIDGELEKGTLAVHSRVDPFPSVSGEKDAIDPMDQDGVNNLVNRDAWDDGVLIPGPFVPGGLTPVIVTVQSIIDDVGFGPMGRYDQAVAAKRLYLNAWADWNGDGLWATPGEKIIGTGSPTGRVAIDPQTWGVNGRYTIGEAFTDSNGSGAWEPGETFTDTAGATEAVYVFFVVAPPVIAPEFYLRFRLDYGEDVGVLANHSGNLAQDRGQARFGEVEDYKQQKFVAGCGPYPYWVEGCPAGVDVIESNGLISLDLNDDCGPDTSLQLEGPVTVGHSDPSDDSATFPGVAPSDGVFDVIDTEILALELTGGGVTLRAGAGQSQGLAIQPSYGAIVQQQANPSLADSFFHVFFEVDMGGGNYLYNQSPHIISTTIDSIPPKTIYIPPTVDPCVPLFTSPVPGEGIYVANLVSGCHGVGSSCVEMLTTGSCCTSDGACTSQVSQHDCMNLGGTFTAGEDCIGDGGTVECVDTGACCQSDGTCTEGSEADCAGFVCDVTAISGATCFGDADGNGIVNAADRGFVTANIGRFEPELLCRFDMDGNGVINAADRGQVSANIGSCNSLPNYQNGSGLNAAGNGPDPRFPASDGVFQGYGTYCDMTTCPVVKTVDPGSDCWVTDCSGSQYSFADNPIPADFFGPGSDPFTGTVVLGGIPTGPFGTDTEITRLDPLEFAINDLPSTSSTRIQVTRLDLSSCSPVDISFDGGTSTASYDMIVSLSPTSVSNGMLTATKHSPNCGTLDLYFFVQPVFTFVEVGNPGNSVVLDTAVAGIPELELAASGMPFVQEASLPGCDPNFSPGYDCPEDEPPCCVEQCHSSFGTAPHEHCASPPDCAVYCTPQTGACCLSDGTCAELTADDCNAAGGVYSGDGTDCGTVVCTPPFGACCQTGGGCLDGLTQGDCDAQGGAYQGDGTDCGTVSCPNTKGVPPGSDCWSTPCGGTQYSFADNPLPPGFFGPGSDPFTGSVTLGGVPSGPLGTDTEIARLDTMVFDLDNLPSTSSTPVQVTRLTLQSCSPVTVSSFGGGATTQYDVQVNLAPNPVPPGTLTATKHQPDCGRLDVVFFVQPVFTFTEVGNPGNVRTFDTGAAGISPMQITGQDMPFVQNAGLPGCDPNFSPGYDCPGGGDPPCCVEQCHSSFGTAPHDHCVTPPDCGMYCTPPTGACCLPGGSCAELTADDCNLSGGVYHGDFSTCGSVMCAPNTGACCYSDGNCSDALTEGDCTIGGGTYQGDGSDCGTVFCPQPTGACCYGDGSCFDQTADSCSLSGGSYFGDGTDCGTTSCPQPTGACCLSGGGCSDGIYQPDCDAQGGSYQGNGSDCGTVSCSTTDDCVNAVFIGDGTTPFDPAGATTDGPNEPSCGFPFGGAANQQINQDRWYSYIASCSGTLYVDTCGGASLDTRLAVYADCGICPPAGPPLECNDDHANATENDNGFACPGGLEASLSIPVTAGQCVTIRAGVFSTSGTVSGPDVINVTCQSETFGACCLSNGTCTDTTSTDCSIQGGSFQGDGTDCGTTSCPQPTGACCNFSGMFCTEETSDNCSLSGGSYFGDGTFCIDDPCGFNPETGACCEPGGTCFDTDQPSCAFTFFPGQACFEITCSGPGSNDECAGAVPAGDGVTPFDSTGMTTSGPIEPVCNFPFGDDNIHQDQWFTYTAPCNGQLYVDTCGGFAGDPRLAIYHGCGFCPPSAPPSECNDDHGNATEGDTGFSCPSGLEASLSIPAAIGNCYTIRVGTFSATTSTAPDQLNIQCVPATFGACCQAGGSCFETTDTDCSFQGGSFQGGGTNCGTTFCPAPTGACCNFSLLSCSELTANDCAGSGGSYWGDGTSCAGDPCGFSQPIGACCNFGGLFCSELNANDCSNSGGSYWGDGTTCVGDPCGFNPTTGACCNFGSCFETDPADCSSGGGSYLGDGTDCTGDPCGTGSFGACCDPGGGCFETEASGCSFAHYPGQLCFQVSCTAAGACCQVQPGPGCGDPGIEGCVCAVDPYCCTTQWDSVCVDEVTGLGCGVCP